MSRTFVIAASLLLLGIASAAPPAAAEPDLPPDIGSGCGMFHWHWGAPLRGELPGYHYHVCY